MTLPTYPPYDEARRDFAARLAAAAAEWKTLKGLAYDLPVEAENRVLVDLASPQAQRPFLTWGMSFRGANAASLGGQPIQRQWGQATVAAKVKDGAGSGETLQLLSLVAQYLTNWEGSVVTTFAASLQEGFVRQGWYFLPCLITYKVDYLAVAKP